ncbi:hypothetical protein DL96DRAFT_1825316 [Flagelloscypha sp. PMI_526]|nr:hypothetical protein DL96DRAFT_1825316 [Flagelloscypha sp. PMI_526]
MRSLLVMQCLVFLWAMCFPSTLGLKQTFLDDTAGSDMLQYSAKTIWTHAYGCPTCGLQPDKNNAFLGTWTATQAMRNESPAYFDFTFRGIGVDIYFILGNKGPRGDAYNTKAYFTLDGVADGSFLWNSDGTSNYYYNHSVYTKDGLHDGKHTLRVGIPDPSKEPADYVFYYDYAVVRSADKPIAVIAGAAGGGGAAVVLLAILSWIYAKPLLYVLASLAFLIFGWWLFGRRRLNFYADKNVGQVQITLFLSPDEVLRDSEEDAQETLLAWQVFDIGHAQTLTSFALACQHFLRSTQLHLWANFWISLHTGHTKFGFGTVSSEKGWITSEEYEEAPATWTGDNWEVVSDKSYEHPEARITGPPMGIALGTFEKRKAESTFKPFLWVKEVNEDTPFTYSQGKNLYLHVFLTNGYQEGRHSADLVSKFNETRLTKKGIKLSHLKPISQWHIKKVDGKIKLAKMRGAKLESSA